MTFADGSFQDLAAYIKSTGKKIICYGAGMLPLYTEALFRSYGLAEQVFLFIDGDTRKKGLQIHYAGREIQIETPECLINLDSDKYILLITAERYMEIQNVLSRMDLSGEWECYAYPLLNHSYFKSIGTDQVFQNSSSRIPKIIHYIWFGGREKTALHQRCIESWHRFCPDFQILEWNEGNYNIHKTRYMKQAYENQKWAYVSDYARMDVLYQYGGIYLDADVELFRSLDALLSTDAFLCFSEWPVPNSGAGAGCVKGNALMKELMETREYISFVQEDGKFDSYTNSNYEMKVLTERGFQMDFTFQLVDGVALYPPDVIAPISTVGEKSFISERTLGIHHCRNTWRN